MTADDVELDISTAFDKLALTPHQQPLFMRPRVHYFKSN